MPIATSLKSVYPLGGSQKTTSISRCVLLVVFWDPPSGCTHFKDEANSHIYLKSPRARRVLPRLGTPARLLPRDVRDELRSKFGCHRPNIERMVRPIRFGSSIERMVYDEFWGCGRADCGLSCSRRAADSGAAGRTATGIGREKGVERLLLGRGPYLATPTSARNAPSDTPGDRARARHCVSGLFCVRDDLAEIAAIKGRG